MNEITENPSKYVVVLAHADGWGALSANKLIKHLHHQYPDLGIHLIVSQATKDAEGKIRTKHEDLKPVRELKETNLLEYFKQVDELYETQNLPPDSSKNLTFKQLAKHYCSDAEVHYTTSGGRKGGDEVQTTIESLEKHYGHGPEVLLSVDTMAFVPEALHDKYHCFSTHPGPLDQIHIEGMQGTLRSLVHEVLYDQNGNRLPDDTPVGFGTTCVKGTLFLQHPELDKGPPLETVLVPVVPGMSAYEVRDNVYNALVESMIGHLPVLLDTARRTQLVSEITQKKAALDAMPHRKIPELEAEPLASWQGKATGYHDLTTGEMDILQNKIVDSRYIKNIMRGFYPNPDAGFDTTFDSVFGNATQKVVGQSRQRLTDPWALFAKADTDYWITGLDTNGNTCIFNNRIPVLDRNHRMHFTERGEEGFFAFQRALVNLLGGNDAVMNMQQSALVKNTKKIISKKPPEIQQVIAEFYPEGIDVEPRKPSRDIRTGR